MVFRLSGMFATGRSGFLILLYSSVTWAGMSLFGKEAWLRGSEAFSVFFGISGILGGLFTLRAGDTVWRSRRSSPASCWAPSPTSRRWTFR